MNDPEPAGLMGLLERVAVRLAHEGAAHPVAGAAALAARGHAGMDQAAFARAHELAVETVDAAERGDLPLNELPETLLSIVVDHPGLDLVAIERLDARMRALPGPGREPVASDLPSPDPAALSDRLRSRDDDA